MNPEGKTTFSHHIEVFAQFLPYWDFPLPLDLKYSPHPSPPNLTYCFSFLHK